MINTVPVNLNAKLSGMYKFSIESADGTIKESDWIENLILDSGLDLLGNDQSSQLVVQFLQIGTGTIPTEVTQTALQSLLATTSMQDRSAVNKGAPLYETEIINNYVFAQGAVVGNITEVGVCQSATGVLFSRSLITDEKGVPTALTVVALDRLTVYYKLTMYPTITDSAGSFVINNVTYNYVSRLTYIQSIGIYYYSLAPYYFSRLANVQFYNETCTGLSDITGTPIGYFGGSNNISMEVYSLGSHQSKGSVTIDINQATVPIKAAVCFFGASTQFIFTPSIPKTNTNQLTLRFTFSWGRG